MIDAVNVVLMNMPVGVNEAVTKNEDESYTIFIDDKLSPSGRLNSYNHAIQHICGCDFNKTDVQKIEIGTH